MHLMCQGRKIDLFTVARDKAMRLVATVAPMDDYKTSWVN
jgi:hypothetical protein